MATTEQQMLDALPGVVCTVDLDGRVTAIARGRRAEDADAPVTGSEPDVLGAPVHEVIPEAGSREHLDSAIHMLRTGRAQQVSWEVPARPEFGHGTWLVQVTPVLDRASVSGFCFSLTDIADLVRSRQTLLESGIALTRAVGLDRLQQELAHQAREVLGADALAVALADEQTAALRLSHHSGFSDEPSAIEARLRPAWIDAVAGGDIVTGSGPGGTELTVAIRSAEGVVGAMTVGVEGLTAPHLVDEAHRRARVLALQAGAAIEHAWLTRSSDQKRRLDAIGEVAAGVAHELRNPLFGISSAAQLLRFRAKDDPVIEKNVGRILREVEGMNRMATSLLEYGRPHPVRLTPADPDAVWDDVLDAERGRLESSAIVITRTRAKPPARCAIDADQLAQVFVNLLVNAVDAAPEASDISLVTEVLATGAWRCRLRNAGAALAPETVGRAFEIFFSTKPGAPGLGLPISQRIIEEHGGTIALESTPADGTTVTVVLPPAA